MNALGPLRRIRLELDRSLRVRPFFARAMRDELSDLAYAHLVRDLAALVQAISNERSADLVGLARTDELALGVAVPSEPAPVIESARAIALAPAGRVVQLSDEVLTDVCLAILGTSWARDAAECMARRSRRSRSFLRGLSGEGTAALSRLEAGTPSWIEASPYVYSFAELARGALLGLATWLDSAWPVPIHMTTLIEGE